MRFPRRLACALLVLGLASPAYASLIPDPTIGVRGIRSGSAPITNGNWLPLMTGQCDVGTASDPDFFGQLLDASSYRCQSYHILPVPEAFEGFTTMTLETRAGDVVIPGSLYQLNPLSLFRLDPGLTRAVFYGVEDQLRCSYNYFTSDGLIGPVVENCSEAQPYATHFQFFFLPLPTDGLEPPFYVRLRSTTYLTCVDGDCSSTTVPAYPTPEPAGLLLLALGTTLVAARRLGRRQ